MIPLVADGPQPRYTWQMFAEDAQHLLRQIHTSGKQYDSICAIPRGGAVLGTYLSYALEIPVDHVWEPGPFRETTALVVDDNVVTGKSLSMWTGRGFDCAVLVRHPFLCVLDDRRLFVGRVSDELYLFPWESPDAGAV